MKLFTCIAATGISVLASYLTAITWPGSVPFSGIVCGLVNGLIVLTIYGKLK